MVPISDCLIRVTRKMSMPLTRRDHHPGSLEVEHDVHRFRRDWQRGFNGGGIGVNPVRPPRVGLPQRAATLSTEVSPPWAFLQDVGVFIVCATVQERHMRLARYTQRTCLSHHIDRIATATRGLTAKGTVTAHIGIRGMRQNGKCHCIAITTAL